MNHSRVSWDLALWSKGFDVCFELKGNKGHRGFIRFQYYEYIRKCKKKYVVDFIIRISPVRVLVKAMKSAPKSDWHSESYAITDGRADGRLKYSVEVASLLIMIG